MEKVDYKTRKVQETYVNNRGVTKTRTINETYTETNTYYYHKNHLNSIVAITDNSGNILEEYEYDVFGKPYSKDILTGKITNLKPSTIGNTRLFTGREYERGLQLYYNRARYYNPELGRFISRDPIDISDDVNLYSYVGNNSVNYVDLMGTEGKPIITGNIMGGILNSLLGIETAYAPSNNDFNKYDKDYGIYGDEVILGAGIIGFNKAGKVEDVLDNTKDFFKNTKYTEKVLNDMKNDKYHGFPKFIDNIASENGKINIIKGADGKDYYKLTIPGELNGKKGVYEYIKDSFGNINHRLFNIKK